MTAVIAACAPAPSAEPPSQELASPWSAPALSSSAVPAIYAEVWDRAENRARCALIAPRQLDLSLEQSAQPRAATFSGGWAVAYDLPQTRSAFGVAGSGASAWSPTLYQDWPHKRVYADSSRVGYGPNPGTEPNWLAYIQIPGQECLYNVWSRRGREHLEELISELRFVRRP